MITRCCTTHTHTHTETYCITQRMTRVSHIHWHSFSNAQVIQYVSNFTATVLYGNKHTDLVRCYSLLTWRCQICGVVGDLSILHFSGLQWKTRVKGRKMTFIRNFLTTGTLVSSTETMSFHWWRVSISLSRSYSDMVELWVFFVQHSQALWSENLLFWHCCYFTAFGEIPKPCIFVGFYSVTINFFNYFWQMTKLVLNL